MSSDGKSFSIAELAELCKCEARGDLNLAVCGIADSSVATADKLAIAYNRQFADALSGGKARAALLDRDSDWQDLGLDAVLYPDRPRFALALISELFAETDWQHEGIARTAIVAESARIGPGSSIGENTIIGDRVDIGAGARIGNHVSIARDCRIGVNAHIHDGVRIGREVTIGGNFIIESNSVIGSSGFSYETAEEGAIEEVKQTFGADSQRRQGRYFRIHSSGGVVIGDNVEIGSGCCIDRGTLTETRIGSGTKLDNLVHIAHNVVVGRDCLLCGQVGIAGSAVIGDRSILAGKAGVKDHIRVGDDVIAAGATQIFSNVADGQRVMGDPATTMKKSIENYRAFRRMSRLAQRVAALEERLDSRKDTG